MDVAFWVDRQLSGQQLIDAEFWVDRQLSGQPLMDVANQQWMQHCFVTMGFLPFVMPEQPVKNYSTNWKKLLITLTMRSIWDAARITWTPLISIRHRVQRPTVSDSVGTPICWTKVLLCAGGHRWRGVLVMWNGHWRLGCTHHQVLFALTHLQLPCSNPPKTEEWEASQQWRIMARLSCL